MKHYFLLLALVIGFETTSQTPADDAHQLKKAEEDLWYTDKSFILPPNQRETGLNTNDERILTPKTAKNIISILGYGLGIAILGALGYAVYSFSGDNRKKKPSDYTREIDPENLETKDDLHQVDFKRKIQEAKNYRQAIRFYYLWLLQDLSKASLIKFEKDKTNLQYADELKNHKKASGFNICTQYYNFVWYGEYPVSPELYEEVVSHFKKLLPHD